jgi:hypothetical protein
VIDQNKNKIVNELDNPEPKLVKKATFDMLLPASIANNLSNNKNIGAPGGCTTCNL